MISSAYFTRTFDFGSAALISLIIIENRMGPNTTPFDVDKAGDHIIDNNALLMILQKTYDPVDDIRVKIGCFKLVTYYLVWHFI